MVRALDQEQENYKSRLYHFKGMQENVGGRHTKSMTIEEFDDNDDSSMNAKASARSQPSKGVDRSLENQQIGSALKSRLGNDGATGVSPLDRNKQPSDVDMLKERFAKLLLGEDMSGGGKGVSSALALSNAITNHAASVFGEQCRLEPMAPERKARWKKEIDWLLSVSDHIVEFVPSQQKGKNGMSMEIMTTKQRTDLQMNMPALRKLDAMLIECLENFKDQHEFSYISKDANESEKANSTKRNEEKWWLPTPKVPPNGLSDVTKKWLQFQNDSVNQVLKAAMAINAQVLSEMEIPENYIECLPKNGRASLGDSIYKSITVEHFDPHSILSTVDLTSEHKILDFKNKIEASIVIWRRKMTNKDCKSTWGSTVSVEKREIFEDRAETILLLLKQRFPGIPQSALDISKIQFNKDVGHAILESYSRILESLAFTVLSRIEDVLHADSLARNPSLAERRRNPLKATRMEEHENMTFPETPISMTLSDFMGWTMDQGEKKDAPENTNDFMKESDDIGKYGKSFLPKIVVTTNRKVSYIEKLENLGGLRSPTSRH